MAKVAAVPPGAAYRRYRLISVGLVIVIAVALSAAGLAIAELYARNRADKAMASAVQCLVQDTAKVSLGSRPILAQYLAGHYDHISVESAGNRFRAAKGMAIDLDIRDIRVLSTAESKGTIGSLDAALIWSADGFLSSIREKMPTLGGLVTGVGTDPAAGTMTIETRGPAVILKPQVVNDALAFEVVNREQIGAVGDRVQTALDGFAADMAAKLPLGIRAQSAAVTGEGVVTRLSTRNANIPQGGDQNQCFATL